MTTDTPEMVERVARAICVAACGKEDHWREDVHIARAAIAAMQKPTEKMIDAGRAVNTLTPDNCLGLKYVSPEPAWYAMINEALR